MELTGRFKFLGVEEGVSKAGTKFTRLGLLQGLKSEVLFPADDVVAKVKNIPIMSEVNCLLSINVRDDKTAYVGIKDIFQVK